MRKGNFYFLDLPIYRLTEDRYYNERDAYVNKFIDQNSGPPQLYDEENAALKTELEESLRSHMNKSYGGIWNYNEIVGYVRLYLLGTQIRGEHWQVDRKRIVRTRKKTLELRHWKLATELDLPTQGSNAEIYKVVLEYVEDCKVELDKLYLDTDQLTTVGPYIDWRGLFEWA